MAKTFTATQATVLTTTTTAARWRDRSGRRRHHDRHHHQQLDDPDPGRRHRRAVHRDAQRHDDGRPAGADDINVSPIAFDDAYNVVGNTTFTAARPSILGSDDRAVSTLSADAEFFPTIGANGRRRPTS